jgi:hypothetical protein
MAATVINVPAELLPTFFTHFKAMAAITRVVVHKVKAIAVWTTGVSFAIIDVETLQVFIWIAEVSSL